LLGALFVGATDERTSVWTVSRDLSPGTQLTADDLIAVSVEVDRVDRYVRADSSAVVGRRLATAVLAGELLPVSAVAGNPASGRLVTIPVEPLHAPTDLAHGNRVDVYVSPRDAVSAGVSRLVVSNALVADVAADLDSPSGEIAVILQVDPAQTPALISASRGGVIDLVAVPPGAPS
jgi:Flp pilus assembly protein CpaB